MIKPRTGYLPPGAKNRIDSPPADESAGKKDIEKTEMVALIETLQFLAS